MDAKQEMRHVPEEAELLRIFIGEADKHQGRPLYEVIVEEARRRGLAGATVLRGAVGFGAHSLIHTAKVLRLSEELPLVIEIVSLTPLAPLALVVHTRDAGFHLGFATPAVRQA